MRTIAIVTTATCLLLAALPQSGRAAGLSLADGPGPTISERTVFYDVAGDSKDELQAELRSKGPTLPDGRHCKGWTKWRISWKYESREVGYGGRCKLSDVRVSADIEYTMPRLVNSAAARPGLSKTWDKIAGDLKSHLQVFGQHGVGAARDIYKKLVDLPEALCEFVGENADGEANTIIEDYKKLDADYMRKKSSCEKAEDSELIR
ncbi:MAG: DUF922 domain-containing protein [Rhodospirillaceae bacterium]